MDVPAAAAQQVDAASQSTNPFVRDSVCERPPANAEGFGGTDGSTEADVQADDFGLFRKGRKLCIRHEKMADRGVNAQLQASLDALPLADRQAINGVWSTFSSSSHPRREIILKGLLTMCCFSQLSMLSAQTHELIRLDPFALFPREVSLKVLSFLDPLSLGKAVQVSRDWRELADDDILWRGMCAQHIERKCTKCGWGLPLLERKRLRLEIDGHYEESTPSSPVGPSHPHGHSHHHHASDSAQMAHHHHHHHQHADAPHIPTVLSAGPVASGSSSSSSTSRQVDSATLTPNRRKRGTPDASASDSDEPGPSSKRRLTPLRSPSGSPPPPGTTLVPLTAAKAKAGGPCRTLTRPWKDVYTERLIIERNWRKGRYESKTLKGHSNSIMCLQVLESESWMAAGCDAKGKDRATNRSGPSGVLITGSYDRTARVWDLESGKEVMVMRGHARGIRALQFDGAILITGSMDHTMRIWNWRTGACIRTLAGHTEGVICLNYDKNVLASGSADSTIKIWNFRDASCFTLRGHRDWVNSVVLWDSIAPAAPSSSSTSSGTTAVSPPPHASALPATPNGGIDAGKMLFSGSDDGTIRLWDLNTRECVRVFEGHVGQVQSMKILVVDRDSRDDEEAELELAGHRSGGHRPAPSETTSSYEPNALGIVGPPSHPLPSSAAHGPPPTPLGPSASSWRLPPQPDGDDKQVILVSASLDNTVRIWDIETGRSRKTFFGHIEGVWGVDADPLRVVSSSHDRTVKVWSRDDGKCTQTLVGHRSAVTCLQLTDTKIISGSDDGEVRLWDFGANHS